MKISSVFSKPLITVAFTLLTLSCGSDEKTGSLTISLIDDPIDTAKSVKVEITSIEVRGNGAPRELTINKDLEQPVDLLKLENGFFATIVDGNDNSNQLSAGSYSNVKIGIASASLTFTDDPNEVPTPATVPPDKFNISGPFTISEGSIKEIILVFNVHNALHMTGNGKYILNPSLKIIEKSVSGWITGSVLPIPSKTGIDPQLKVKVTANQGTENEAATFASQDGTFELNPLREGTHSIRVEWITMQDTNADGVQEIIDCKREDLGDFVVLAEQATDTGTVELTTGAASCL
ncbi:MAG: DUF4382 domain-containing protein [bacterium]